MPERRRDEPLHLDGLRPAGPAAGEPSRPLQMADGRVHRGVMRRDHLLGGGPVGQRPQQRHGLRCPEGVVEPRDLPCRMRSELITRGGMTGVEHRTQLRAGDLTRQAELLGTGPEPPAGFFTAGEVVVLDPVVAAGDGGEVVVRPPRAHPPDVQHRSATSPHWSSASLCCRFMGG